MAGFVASSEVEQLDFDFNPYVEASGVIPEPSAAQIQEFQKSIKTLFGDEFRASMLAETDRRAALDSMLDTSKDDEMAEKWGQLLDAVSAVCSGEVTREMLDKLPFRIQQHFIGWLMGTLTNPNP